MTDAGTMAGRFDAITFDFYNTLAYHRNGRGRGPMLMEYFQHSGIESDPWEHQVLYDVFGPEVLEYDPSGPPEHHRRHRTSLAERVFRRLNVRASKKSVAQHADYMWQLLGPASLAVFSDVQRVLASIRAAGIPLAVISNWQHGLHAFCTELGLATSFRHILSSAEVGHAKPAPEIFHEACRRLGVLPHRVLHVGDSPDDDVVGGRSAGIEVILIDRRPGATGQHAPWIPSLAHLPKLLGLRVATVDRGPQ